MGESPRTARDVVREFIERDGVIRNGLARGLVNVRALARYIQIATHENYSFEALVSAIHRYPTKENAERYQRVGGFIQKMTMKNEIVRISVYNEPDIPVMLARFSEKVDYGRGDTFHLATGIDSVNVLIDSKNKERLLAALPKRSVREVLGDLAEIIVLMSEKAIMTKGVAATVTTQLAVNDVNLRDLVWSMVQSAPHAIIVVEERDALRAYRAIEDLRQKR